MQRGTCRVEEAGKLVLLRADGGKVELRAIEEAKRILASTETEPRYVEWNLQKDIGMTCGGVVHMFFEVLNWRTDKGEIGLATSEDGLAWKYRQIVLAEPFHLSYPHVLRWKNYYYMIPECCRTGSVRLYKAVEFPLRWSFAGTLLEGPHFVDASPFRFKGKWWLFTETNPNEKHDTLRLYHAENLSGPWVEHPQSPIVEADRKLLRDFLTQQSAISAVWTDWGTTSFVKLRHGSADTFLERLRSEFDTSAVPGCFFEMPDHFRIGMGVNTGMFAEGLNSISRTLR